MPKDQVWTLPDRSGTERTFRLSDPDLPDWIADNVLGDGDYPYDKKLKRKTYKADLEALQVELAKLQSHALAEGLRILVLFEGRDTAGKGGTIKRFMEYLNPRHARSVALGKPTETEQGQWYFQRYVPHLPSAGEIVLFDRSWYNRAGIERVMGFCSDEQLAMFLRETPQFEGMLVRDGILFFKFFLTINRETQLKRFHKRRHSRLKRWKLSEIDLAAINKWDAYTEAKEDMFRFTHTRTCPWTVVRANDKRRARLAAIRTVLAAVDYPEKDHDLVRAPDPEIAGQGDAFFYSA